MTGIERLYKLIADIDVRADPKLWDILRCGTEGDWDCEERDCKTLGSTLAAIADQIEREQGGRVSRMRVLAVVTEMERHCLGHEGMEDSPVARWARELREALGGDGRDPAADVSASAYDLLPEEDREAIAWVREHGGIESVKAQRRESMPRAAYERKKAGFLNHIAECETALGRRREIISELNHRASDLTRENAELRKRAMPEGYEWPRYEDGEPVGFGDDVSRNGEDFEVKVIALYRDGSFSLNFWAYSKGERVKRHAHKVYDADGVEIRVGDRVWSTHLDEPHEWIVIDPHEDRDDSQTVLVSIGDRIGHARPSDLTHRVPVLAADGKPLLKHEMVYEIKTGERYFVTNVFDGMTEPDFPEHTVECRKYEDVVTHMFRPSQLTHQRPVLGAEGNRIEQAMDVWWVCEGDERGIHAERLHVESIGDDGLVTCSPFNGGTWVELEPSELYVKKPALDADGVLCREGDEVWEVRSHRRREIVGTHYRDYETGEPLILCDGDDAIPIPATCVTHTKPEPPDSWERIEEDAKKYPCHYFGHERNTCDGCPVQSVYGSCRTVMTSDLVRRCKALAEKENRNE